MIKKLLLSEQRNLHIQEHIITDIYVPQPINVRIVRHEQNTTPGKLLWVSESTNKDKDCYQTYFLPWKEDTGYYIDLPKKDIKANLFLTDGLSGCCVGVQDLENKIRVCHYNSEEEFNTDDFQRYSVDENYRSWLLPKDYKIDDSHYRYYPTEYRNPEYHGYSKLYWTFFWGEFEDGQWKFYYQTPDKVIHDFPY